MPASTKASYVGRFAPPGYPNTTSTPSALRHSMTASTARIIGCGPLSRSENENPSWMDGILRSLASGRLGHGPVGGELELGPAPRAERVVQGHDLAAAGACAVRLVALVAVQHRGEQAHPWEDRADQEPED